jgi:hypothetical protein
VEPCLASKATRFVFDFLKKKSLCLASKILTFFVVGFFK